MKGFPPPGVLLTNTPEPYEALLLVSFGGPEHRTDVIPFLQNVLRGRNVPRERMLEVAEHYFHFGGKSPINDQNKALIESLQAEFAAHGCTIPIYWGNRNWHPMLEGTLRRMKGDGIHKALALATSAFGSYSGCRQYREDIDKALAAVGEGAPVIHKLPTFHNQPGFIAAMAARVHDALEAIPEERRAAAKLMYTAHSVPVAMAASSPYVAQLEEACTLVSQTAGREGPLVYQSRSGQPTQPWLEPDVLTAIRELSAAGGLKDLVLAPIGFLSDHMEVVYDLDTEAADLCRELGIHLERAGTVGTHPAFVSMVREMVQARLAGTVEADVCAPGCCAAPVRPGRP